jgi:phosphate starvation-inducible protein PhoH
MSQTKNNILNAAIAAHILGKKTNVRLTGSPERVTAIQEAITVSKELYTALCDDSITIETVTGLVKKKRKASQRFQEVLGVPWTL